MKKITLAGSFPFTEEQKTRLSTLGEMRRVEFSSAEEWLAAVQDSDVILSDGDYLFENLENLKMSLLPTLLLKSVRLMLRNLRSEVYS
jgi:hypothetical protein